MSRSSLEKTLIKDIRRSYSRLSRRMAVLLKHSNMPQNTVVSPALEVFKQSEFFDTSKNQIEKVSVKNLSLKQLRSLRNKIYYIDGLKTSYFKFAKMYTSKNSVLMNSIKNLPQELQDKFWNVYGKFAQTYKNYDKFKYDIFGDIFENLTKFSEEDLINILEAEVSDDVDEIFNSYISHIDYTI